MNIKTSPFLFTIIMSLVIPTLLFFTNKQPVSHNASAANFDEARYNSIMTVNYAPYDGMKVDGIVKNLNGDPLAAYVRIFNLLRTPNHVDVVAQAYANINGEFSIDMPIGKNPGEYEVIIYRGPEYEFFSQLVDIQAGMTASLDVSLARIADMAADGWYGGDVHQHSRQVSPGYGSDGSQTMEQMAEADVAMGLHFAAQTDHNQTVSAGNERFIAEGSRYSLDSGDLKFLPIAGNEVTTSAGHFNAWDPTQNSGYYAVNTYVDTSGMETRVADIFRIAQDMREHSLLSVINHPNAQLTLEQMGSPGGMSYVVSDLDWMEYKDLTLSFDAVEMWNGGNGFMTSPEGIFGSIPYFGTENDPAHWDIPESKHLTFFNWYKLLNSGVRFPGVGSSDSHNRNGVLESGMYDQLIAGVRAATGGYLPVFDSPPAAVAAIGRLVGVEGALMYYLKDNAEHATENMATLPGMPRNYVYLGNEAFSPENLAQAIKDGRSFITNGPMLKAEINGRIAR